MSTDKTQADAERLGDRLNNYRLKPVGLDGNRELRTEVLRSRFSNLKVIAAIAGLGTVLVADVFHNRLVGHVSA